MKRIVFKRPDGGLSIIVPAINTYPSREKLTEDEALERAKKDIPSDASDIIIVDESEIPQDRSYRNAWTHDGRSVVHDMPKARELHREKMRTARKAILESLDIEYLAADEAGNVDEKKKIAAKKKALRDVTKIRDIDDCHDIDGLKKVWPDCLSVK